ncbi:MAG: Uma2 family endonuclease [Gemmataceae bacterium]|nr:Uma2 family endonuclease [Gemmataceae bacterium]
MSTKAPPTLPPSGPPPPPMRRLTVAEYHHMIDTGILSENDNVELLEGWIVPKMPRKPPHDGVIQMTSKALGQRLPSGWEIRIQSAITTADSEPEPDIGVVRGDERTYLHRHPQPQDVGLLVEVAETSLTQDRQEKGRIYARAGIAHYWIINLVDNQVECYSNHSMTSGYKQRIDYRALDQIPFVLDGQLVAMIPASEFLP